MHIGSVENIKPSVKLFKNHKFLINSLQFLIFGISAHLLYSIVDVIDPYMDDKYGAEADDLRIRGFVDRFPGEILMKNAVPTWMAAVMYAQEQRRTAVGQH